MSCSGSSTVSVSSIRNLFETKPHRASLQTASFRSPPPPPPPSKIPESLGHRHSNPPQCKPTIKPKPQLPPKSAPPLAVPFSYLNNIARPPSFVARAKNRFEMNRTQSMFVENSGPNSIGSSRQPIQRNISTGSTGSTGSTLSSTSYYSAISRSGSSINLSLEKNQTNQHYTNPEYFSLVDNYLRGQVASDSPIQINSINRYSWNKFILSPSSELLFDQKHKDLVRSMSIPEIQIYEIIFVIVSSERSYLSVLEQIVNFATNGTPSLVGLSINDQKTLFSKIGPILELDRRLYRQFVQSIINRRHVCLSEILSILSSYLNPAPIDGVPKFQPYIDYLRTMDNRTVLMQDRNRFNIDRFPNLLQVQLWLIAPLQRINRYSILLNSICDRLKSFRNDKLPSHWIVLNPGKLLHLAERCWLDARSLTEDCYQALNNEKDLRQLIELKQCLVGPIEDLQGDLVSSGRRILDKIPVQVNLLNKKLDSILILFNDLLVLVWDKMSQNKQLELLAWAPWRMVEYSKGPIPINGVSNRLLYPIHQPISHFKSQTCSNIQFRNKKFSTTIFKISFISTRMESHFFDQYQKLRSQSKLNS